jgi:hypothetical protein
MRDTGSTAEVTACLASVAFSLDQDSVVAGWGHQSQLIESDHLAASLCDSLAGTLGDAESTDAELRNLQQTQVVGDSADDDCDIGFLCLALVQQTDDALQRNDGLVDFAHKQTLEDDLVKLLVRAAVQEAVQLKQRKVAGQYWSSEGELGVERVMSRLLSNNKTPVRGYVEHRWTKHCKICERSQLIGRFSSTYPRHELLFNAICKLSTHLDQQTQVHILRFWCSATDFSVPFVANVDTLKRET